MKKLLLSFLALAFISACSSESNDPCEGLILDFISQTLYIELVDNDGANLIENETYEKNEIYADLNGTVLRPVVYDENAFPSLPEELKNVIVIPIFGENGKETSWNIQLNENERDTMGINVEIESEGCSGPFYNILSITYNSRQQEVEDIGNNGYKIIFVKE